MSNVYPSLSVSQQLGEEENTYATLYLFIFQHAVTQRHCRVSSTKVCSGMMAEVQIQRPKPAVPKSGGKATSRSIGYPQVPPHVWTSITKIAMLPQKDTSPPPRRSVGGTTEADAWTVSHACNRDPVPRRELPSADGKAKGTPRASAHSQIYWRKFVPATWYGCLHHHQPPRGSVWHFHWQ